MNLEHFGVKVSFADGNKLIILYFTLPYNLIWYESDNGPTCNPPINFYFMHPWSSRSGVVRSSFSPRSPQKSLPYPKNSLPRSQYTDIKLEWQFGRLELTPLCSGLLYLRSWNAVWKFPRCSTQNDDTATNGFKWKFCNYPNWSDQKQMEYEGNWGTWRTMKMCPINYYVAGFKARIEPPQGVFGDDTGMNGL